MRPAEFFNRAVSLSEGFRFFHDEHIQDNDELLPHLLMGDLLRYVGTLVTDGTQPAVTEVMSLLALLDSAFASGDPDTQNCIAVSFVESINVEPFFPMLYPLLGPNLRAEYERQRNWCAGA